MPSHDPLIVRTSRTYRQPCPEPAETRRNRIDTASPADAEERSERLRAAGLVSRLILNSISIFVLSGVFGLAVLATAPNLLGFKAVVVASGSMEPNLRVADVVVLANPAERQAGVGSVINYWVDDDLRIHRVIEVVPDGYRTQGDASRTPDEETVSPEAITGIGIYLVPFIGWPHQWMIDGQWSKIAVSAVALLLLASTERAGFVDRPQPRSDSRIDSVLVRRRTRPVVS